MITIRSAAIDDAEQILGIYSWYVQNTAISFEYEIPTLEEFRGRIEKTLQRYPYLAAEKDGRIIGYTYAGPFSPRLAYSWSAETTIYVDHHLRKQGIGRKLYEAMEEELRKMGIRNLYARIGYPETEDEYLTKNSARFHKHMGFRLIGEYHQCGYKFGRWYNAVNMEKIIGDHPEHPEAIRKWIPEKQ
ncbi:MAG: N-acetyltransferase [Flexilinea sp.]|nr:N-acetyltransferase [Flexilinea sp.]